jgi:hypothetical protein
MRVSACNAENNVDELDILKVIHTQAVNAACSRFSPHRLRLAITDDARTSALRRRPKDFSR